MNHPGITDAQLEALARKRGYKLIDLDDFEYEAHEDHNNGFHEEPIADCPDCEGRDVD